MGIGRVLGDSACCNYLRRKLSPLSSPLVYVTRGESAAELLVLLDARGRDMAITNQALEDTVHDVNVKKLWGQFPGLRLV